MMLTNQSNSNHRGPTKDETQVLKYKLVTLPKGTKKIPQVEFGIPSISVNQNSGQVSLATTSPSRKCTRIYCYSF